MYDVHVQFPTVGMTFDERGVPHALLDGHRGVLRPLVTSGKAFPTQPRMKGRWVGRIATGVNGRRAPRGPRHAGGHQRDRAWNEFFADLVVRGLSGVRMVTSDAHVGLDEAIAANLPGASWQDAESTMPRT